MRARPAMQQISKNLTRNAVFAASLALYTATAIAAPTLRSVSPAQFRTDISQLQALVSACASQPASCDDAKVIGDEEIGDPTHPGGFEMHWDWLRTALNDARTARPDDRKALLHDASAQLDELAQDETSPTGPPANEFDEARTQANNILSKPEFQGDDGPTWWERQKTKLLYGLERIFEGVSRIGSAAPWLGPLLEWLLFTSAAGLLLFFVLRALARQRLRVALGEGATKATAWDRAATDWAKMAEAHAAKHEWREAVHCLYWAAIVSLESRRAWRHNPTRTPREYVQLLKPGSAQREGLGGLTQMLERVWYGLREGRAEEYAEARGLYESLASGSGERLGRHGD